MTFLAFLALLAALCGVAPAVPTAHYALVPPITFVPQSALWIPAACGETEIHIDGGRMWTAAIRLREPDDLCRVDLLPLVVEHEVGHVYCVAHFHDYGEACAEFYRWALHNAPAVVGADHEEP